MFISFIGFSDNISHLLMDRLDHRALKYFTKKPTVEELKSLYKICEPESETEKIVLDNAFRHMLGGGCGYFYGKIFLLKEMKFEF